nr:unnamed protein product [Naegleria fowleri]
MPPKKVIRDSSSESEDDQVAPSDQLDKRTDKKKITIRTRKRRVLSDAESNSESDEDSQEAKSILSDQSSSEHESGDEFDEDNEEDPELRFKKIERSVLEKACINKETAPNQLVVHTIELQNFKSYRDVCTVGPFSSDLNCIIGSNGSGKERNEKLDWFEVERRIKPGDHGASHYFITDGTGARKASKKDVKLLLTKHGVDFDYPDRFIVLQHNTIKLVKQNPNEMMSYLEHLFGTDQLKDQVKQIDIEITENSKQLETIDNERQSILKDLEIIKPKVQQYEQYISLKENVDKLSSELEIAKWRCNNSKLESSRLSLESAEKELSKLQSDLHNTEIEKNKLAKKRDSLTKEFETTEENLKELKNVIKFNQKTLAKKKAAHATISRNVHDVSKNLKKLSDNIDKARDEEEKIAQQIQTIERSITSDQRQQEIVESERKALTEVILRDTKMQEYKNTYEQVEQIKGAQDYQNLLLKEQKLSLVMKEIESTKHRVDTTKCETEILAGEILSMESQELQLKSDIENNQRTLEKLMNRHRELQILKDQLCQQQMISEMSLKHINEHNERYRFVRSIQEMKQQSTSGIFGILSDLYELKDEKYSDAVNSALYPLLKNTVIVKSRDTALNIVNTFSKKKIGIVACEILDELPPINSKSERNMEGPDLIPMMDVIVCDSALKPLLFKHTGNWYITSTISSAKKYSHSGCKKNIVTLNGEIFKSFGEISTCAVSKSALSSNEMFIRSRSCSKLWGHTKDASQTEHALKEIQNRITENAKEIEKNRICLEDEEIVLRTNNTKLQQVTEKKEQLKKDMDTALKQISNYNLELSSQYEIMSNFKLHAHEEQLLDSYRQSIRTLELVLEKDQTNSVLQHISKLREFDELKTNLEYNIRSNSEKLKKLKKKQIGFPQHFTSLCKQKELMESELSSLNESLTSSEDFKIEEQRITKLEKQQAATQEELRLIKAKIVEASSQQDELLSNIESMQTAIKKKEKFISEMNETIKSLQSLVQKKPIGLKKTNDDVDIDHEEKNIKKLEAQLKFKLEELSKITKDLDMDCIQKQKKLKKNMKDQTKRYNRTMKGIERASTLKTKLLHLRFEVFHKVCNRINNTLSQIYKDMGINNNCYISYCENKTTAFEKGVTIYCKPNGSEWIPFSKLSGGQMNLCCAILSLSMMKSFPTPICFFDEMDASLDSINVEMLSKIILEYSKNTQFICISFKFYEKAHHIIGVYHHAQTSCAVPLVIEDK